MLKTVEAGVLEVGYEEHGPAAGSGASSAGVFRHVLPFFRRVETIN